MSLIILTRSPQSWLNLKNKLFTLVKFLAGRNRGPQTVIKNVTLGLSELNYNFKFNPNSVEIKATDIVWVYSGLDALSWALKAKNEGRISKIIAGPSICVVPDECDGMITDQLVDVVIQPSLWVRNCWVDLAPELTDKIQVWASGLEIPEIKKKTSKKKCLVFQKNADNHLLIAILGEIKACGFEPEVIKYGHYRHNSFIKKLQNSDMLVYLSKSESQSIALFEAWSMNVPTIVWNRGFWEYKNYKWFDSKVSAPYLNDQTGIFFNDIDDFKSKFKYFSSILNIFSPRKYILENYTNRLAAKRLIKIVDGIQ